MTLRIIASQKINLFLIHRPGTLYEKQKKKFFSNAGKWVGSLLPSVCFLCVTPWSHVINIYPKDEADGFAGRFSEIYRSSYDGGGLSTPFLSALAPIFIRDKNRTREIFRQGVSSKFKKRRKKDMFSCFCVCLLQQKPHTPQINDYLQQLYDCSSLSQ